MVEKTQETMHLWTTIKLILKTLFSCDREQLRRALAERLAGMIYPKYVFAEFDRIWLEDAPFKKRYQDLVGTNYHSMDRKFCLRSLLHLVDDIDGDLAECGVFEGASSWFICDHFKGSGKTHHLFDSFKGLPAPSSADGTHWRKGDLKAPRAKVFENLREFNFIKIHEGWIPETFGPLKVSRFCFVHIDVDLYQPTLDSLIFFYPRVVREGIVLFDDYGFSTCPGAKSAVDDFMRNKKEKIVHLPTGQAFFIKK